MLVNKLISRKGFGVLGISIALIFSSLAGAQSSKVPFALCYEDQSLFPYFLGEGTSVPTQKPGITIEIVQLLAQKIPEIELSFIRAPWERCQVYLTAGKVAAVVASFKPEREVIGVYPKKENKAEVDPEQRISEDRYVLYKRKNSPLRWNGSSFFNTEGQVVGVPTGYAITEFLQDKGVIVEEARTQLSNFRKLEAGHINAVATLELSGDYVIRTYIKEKANEIIKLSPPLQSKDYYLLLSHQFAKSFPELANNIWKTSAIIRQQEASKISEKYFTEEE